MTARERHRLREVARRARARRQRLEGADVNRWLRWRIADRNAWTAWHLLSASTAKLQTLCGKAVPIGASVNFSEHSLPLVRCKRCDLIRKDAA